ncbi:MAG: biopolymer transporter ExbD [Deltaproteobacteria bacterium]|nr:biopolymer transporter ExbD [Deltaproteobacteria bacterium]
MKVHRFHTAKPRIEMIPLMDVIFLLLVTFIFFSMAMTVQRGITVDLPAAATASVRLDECTVISATNDGRVMVDGVDVAMNEVYQVLFRLHERCPQRTVVIAGDRKAPYETIVFLLDEARRAGISSISVDTKCLRD